LSKNHAGLAALPAIADLLRADFATELVLDPDIIQRFATDSSNLPGHADALGRPQSEHECAVLFRACFAAGIPFTLTGSATPLAGVVISMARMLLPEIYDRIIAESARLGRVYSGEHDTGKRKRRDFLQCYGPAAAEQVRQCKAAVDPLFLMNRGNVLEVELDSTAKSTSR